MEVRLGDATANPYLAIAATLAAMYLGHPGQAGTAAVLEGYGYDPARARLLPQRLPDALDALEADTDLRGVLGEEFCGPSSATSATRSSGSSGTSPTGSSPSTPTTCNDLSDPGLFAAGPPWAVFDELRRDAPCHWNPEPAPNHGFWSVTRHADIAAVAKDEDTFSAEVGAVNLEELDAGQLEIRKSMLETDGVRHRALRRLLQRDFNARSLAGYETFLRGLTARTLDAALAKREFDFVAEVSADFPIRVLVQLLGIEDGHPSQLIAWGNRMIGNTDPDEADALLGTPESEQYRHLPFRSPAALEVFAYGASWPGSAAAGTARTWCPSWSTGCPGRRAAVRADFHNYFLLLIVAGNETTRHTITSTMQALIEHPEAWVLLKEQPELLPAPSRSSSAGPRPSTTSGAPRPGTPSCTASPSGPATRSSCGGRPGTGTRLYSRIRTASMSGATPASRWRSVKAARTCAWAVSLGADGDQGHVRGDPGPGGQRGRAR